MQTRDTVEGLHNCLAPKPLRVQMRLCKHEQILYCLNTENEKLECPYCELEAHYYIWSKVYASFIEKKKTKKTQTNK